MRPTHAGTSNGSAPRSHGGVAAEAPAEGAAPGATASGAADPATAAPAADPAADTGSGADPAAPSADERTFNGKTATGEEAQKPGGVKLGTQAKKAEEKAKEQPEGVKRGLAQLAAKQREVVQLQQKVKTEAEEVAKIRGDIETREARLKPLEAMREKIRNVHENPQAALDAIEDAGVDSFAFVRAIAKLNVGKKPGDGKPAVDPQVAVEAAFKKRDEETAAKAKADADKTEAEKKSKADQIAAKEASFIESFDVQLPAVMEADPEAYPLLQMEEGIGELVYRTLDAHVGALVRSKKPEEVEAAHAIMRKLHSGEESAMMEALATGAELVEKALRKQHEDRSTRLAPAPSGRQPAPGNGQRTAPTLSRKTVPSAAPAATRAPQGDTWDDRVARAAKKLELNTAKK